jgi:hypothetical protein
MPFMNTGAKMRLKGARKVPIRRVNCLIDLEGLVVKVSLCTLCPYHFLRTGQDGVNMLDMIRKHTAIGVNK